jgi:hypothetical protein
VSGARALTDGSEQEVERDSGQAHAEGHDRQWRQRLDRDLDEEKRPAPEQRQAEEQAPQARGHGHY